MHYALELALSGKESIVRQEFSKVINEEVSINILVHEGESMLYVEICTFPQANAEDFACSFAFEHGWP